MGKQSAESRPGSSIRWLARNPVEELSACVLAHGIWTASWDPSGAPWIWSANNGAWEPAIYFTE